MALLFWEGFDSYSSETQLRAARPEILPNWNTRFGDAWGSYFYTSGGRFGGCRIATDTNNWGPGLINLGVLGYGPTELYTGRAIYLPNGTASSPGVLNIYGNAFTSSEGDVRFTIGSGIIYAYNFNNTLLGQSPAGTIQNATWHWLEVRVKMSSNSSTADGIVEVWIDNVKVISNLACITKRSNSSTGYGGTSYKTWYEGNSVDDIYITDTTGSAPWNTRLGDCRIVNLPATKNGIYNTNTSTANAGISTVLSSSDITISNNGVSVYLPSQRIVKTTHSTTTGNLYFEVTVRNNSTTEHCVGISDKKTGVNNDYGAGGSLYGFSVKPHTREIYANRTQIGTIPANLNAGNTICFAVDLDKNKFWIKTNPSADWNSDSSANPANGNLGYSYSNPNFVPLGPYAESDGATDFNINLGNYVFSGSVPSGFSAWNSLNGNTACFINENFGFATDFFTIPNVANNYEVYQNSDLPTTNVQSVYAVAVTTYGRKNDAGDASIKHVIATGQVYNSASISLFTSNTFQRTVWTTNPNTGNQWTKSQVNSAQTGIVIG